MKLNILDIPSANIFVRMGKLKCKVGANCDAMIQTLRTSKLTCTFSPEHGRIQMAMSNYSNLMIAVSQTHSNVFTFTFFILFFFVFNLLTCNWIVPHALIIARTARAHTHKSTCWLFFIENRKSTHTQRERDRFASLAVHSN